MGKADNVSPQPNKFTAQHNTLVREWSWIAGKEDEWATKEEGGWSNKAPPL